MKTWNRERVIDGLIVFALVATMVFVARLHAPRPPAGPGIYGSGIDLYLISGGKAQFDSNTGIVTIVANFTRAAPNAGPGNDVRRQDAGTSPSAVAPAGWEFYDRKDAKDAKEGLRP